MIDEVVSRYLELHSDDKEYLGQLIGQLAAHQTLDDRKNFEGHITGSAYVLSPDRSKLLVIHHRLFDKWLQPGGHWDKGESGPWVTAARETVEETGVSLDHQIITYGTDFRIPFYINTHRIKNRPHKHEPEHKHHDFEYIFMAHDEQLKRSSKEVNITEMAWVHFDDERLDNIRTAVNRMQEYLAKVQ